MNKSLRQEPWLRSILDRINRVNQTSLSFDRWVVRKVGSLTFYPFQTLNLQSTYNIQHFEYNTGGWKRSIKFWTEYLIVYRDEHGNHDFLVVNDEVNGLPIEQRTSVAKKIKSVRASGRPITLVAIVRRKLLDSLASDFGSIESFDVFKFPEDWV